MTDPKRMTAERLEELCGFWFSCEPFQGTISVGELLRALQAERAHSEKVEARCEALRQGYMFQDDCGDEGVFVECNHCYGRWLNGQREAHEPVWTVGKSGVSPTPRRERDSSTPPQVAASQAAL